MSAVRGDAPLPQEQQPTPGAPATSSLKTLRAQFRDGKAALIEHFREARPTAPAAGRLSHDRKQAASPANRLPSWSSQPRGV